MLHRLLKDYLLTVEQAVAYCKSAYAEKYIEEIVTTERVNLRARIRFSQGHLLSINEAVEIVDNQLTWLDYRYHCQDSQNNLCFRYDCTLHFPNLPTCPHHKHLPDNVIASERPFLFSFLCLTIS
jgi:hypothetical protein